MSTVRERLGGKLSVVLGKPIVARAAAWVGLLGFMIGQFLDAALALPLARNPSDAACRFDLIPDHPYVVRKGRRRFQHPSRADGQEWSTDPSQSEQWIHEWVLSFSHVAHSEADDLNSALGGLRIWRCTTYVRADEASPCQHSPRESLRCRDYPYGPTRALDIDAIMTA